MISLISDQYSSLIDQTLTYYHLIFEHLSAFSIFFSFSFILLCVFIRLIHFTFLMEFHMILPLEFSFLSSKPWKCRILCIENIKRIEPIWKTIFCNIVWIYIKQIFEIIYKWIIWFYSINFQNNVFSISEIKNWYQPQAESYVLKFLAQMFV